MEKQTAAPETPDIVAANVNAAAVSGAQQDVQLESRNQTAQTLSEASAPLIRPVRSAKDAINAMYAEDSNKRLSNYLATSAKEIINAGGRATDSKSASSLHRKSSGRQMESSRPSASGLLKVAKVEEVSVPSDMSGAMDPLARKAAPVAPKRVAKMKPTVSTVPPVVKTSLKLGPKKTPAASPRLSKAPRSARSMDINKGPTALAELLASRKASSNSAAPDVNTMETLKVMQKAVQQSTGQAATPQVKTVPRPKMRAPRGLMQDVIRPGSRGPLNSAQSPAPTTPEHPKGRPIDSVKRRFRMAPKDYTAAPETINQSYTASATEIEPDTPPVKPPIEIYGLMEEEPTGKPADNLGVVEDYQPQGDSVSNGISEQKVAQGSGTASLDNNKYTLGAKSPFFLKSVNVEKRPLSSAPTKREATSDGTLYEQPNTEAIGGKNIYTKPEAKKPLPTKPTVIIPASRRSRAPLICLLLLTVILGAAVGAFIYLCFFQYME